MQDVRVAIFDEFQEKYQAISGFENFHLIKSNLEPWFKEANLNDNKGIHTIQKLLDAMAMIVFKNICLNRGLAVDLSKFKG